MIDNNLFSKGVFKLAEAAQLLSVDPRRLRTWVCGKHGLKGHPLIRSDIPRAGHSIAISFVNLIEAKFINTFASYGVSVLSIRYMAEEAARFLQTPHPFATEAIFKTDGRRIFIEAAERAEDPILYDLRGHNFAFKQILAAEFKDVEFSASGLASAWYPRREEAPHVRIAPKVAFGHPALEASGVPTDALFNAYLAGSRNIEDVASWYDVPISEVVEAVRFEESLKPPH